MNELASAIERLRSLVDADGRVHRVVLAAVLLVVGLGAAKLFQRLALGLARRLARWIGAFARGAPSTGESEAFARSLGRVAYWSVVVFSVAAAAELASLSLATVWLNRWVAYLPRVVAAVAIVALGGVAARVVRHFVVSAASSAAAVDSTRLGRVAQLAVLSASWLLAVEQLGIEISFLKNVILIAIAALLGAGALAFGRGGGRVVAAILSAHFVHKLYRVGQRVRIDGVEGNIARITPTALVVDDGESLVVIPARRLSEAPFRILSGPGK